jgi:hypothetical protein
MAATKKRRRSSEHPSIYTGRGAVLATAEGERYPPGSRWDAEVQERARRIAIELLRKNGSPAAS